jgi:hypothetical protein
VSELQFRGWGKTPRLASEVVITEKIDGTNAAIVVQTADPNAEVELDDDYLLGYLETSEDGALIVGAQSRNRLLTLGSDNAGFAGWVSRNAESLATILGPGYHFGEWWGSGIQRRYGLTGDDKRFSLFDVDRYAGFETAYPGLGLVPELARGIFSEALVAETVLRLAEGSVAAPGFLQPEGVVIKFKHGGLFKFILSGEGGKAVG